MFKRDLSPALRALLGLEPLQASRSWRPGRRDASPTPRLGEEMDWVGSGEGEKKAGGCKAPNAEREAEAFKGLDDGSTCLLLGNGSLDWTTFWLNSSCVFDQPPKKLNFLQGGQQQPREKAGGLGRIFWWRNPPLWVH